ncbi:shikimate kinase [uncultured Hydrogenophaga sp.]|uniref:shikimate kinase n=1 Tax=uncultured Hydrogenophaga sp. TaxID=199683 RepID=UPI0026601AB9|nr:shikimate kinase [uncultured Hydrogenophaga sp.]
MTVRTVALVGLPGSGKSTIGRQLARRLGLPFFDSDHVIEQRIGCAIGEFFREQGEDRFRDIESEVISLLAGGEPKVLSTGGGSVLRESNRRALHENTLVVYLRSSPEEVFRRVRHDRNRPLLQVDDPLQKIRDLHTQRDPLYEETAHFTIDTGRPSVPTLVNMIVMQLDMSDIGQQRQ